LDLWGVSVDTWSVTSWTNLRTEALSVERYNRLHPAETPRFPLVTTKLGGGSDPVVAVSDYMRAVPDQLARFITRPFVSLGTDGFGRSDAREALRRYFEVDTAHVVIAVLSELFKAGKLEPSEVERAIKHFDVDPDAVSPFGS
jgi:pyruvate dehydrogenase E1 component